MFGLSVNMYICTNVYLLICILVFLWKCKFLTTDVQRCRDCCLWPVIGRLEVSLRRSAYLRALHSAWFQRLLRLRCLVGAGACLFAVNRGRNAVSPRQTINHLPGWID